MITQLNADEPPYVNVLVNANPNMKVYRIAKLGESFAVNVSDKHVWRFLRNPATDEIYTFDSEDAAKRYVMVLHLHSGESVLFQESINLANGADL